MLEQLNTALTDDERARLIGREAVAILLASRHQPPKVGFEMFTVGYQHVGADFRLRKYSASSNASSAPSENTPSHGSPFGSGSPSGLSKDGSPRPLPPPGLTVTAPSHQHEAGGISEFLENRDAIAEIDVGPIVGETYDSLEDAPETPGPGQ